MTNTPAALLWADTLQQLKCRLPRETFNAWLLGSRVVESGEGMLTIGILRPAGLPWLQHRLRPVIEQSLLLVAGRPIAVDFVPCPAEQKDEEYDADEDEASPAGATPDRSDAQGRPPVGATLTAGNGRPPQPRKKMRRRVLPAVAPPASSPPCRASPEHGTAAGHKSTRLKPTKELGPNDFYIRLKTAFCRRALRLCKGAPLSVLNCLWGHVNGDHVAWPSIETMMRQTGYSRGVVCNAIAKLERLGLIAKRPRHHQSTEYVVLAYAWFGSDPTPALFEEQED